MLTGIAISQSLYPRLLSHIVRTCVYRGFKVDTKILSMKQDIRTYKKRENMEGVGKPKGYSDLNKIYNLDISRGSESGLPDLSKPFLVLGIETSCDDTGVAIVSSNGNILSNVVYSQYEMHERFGGVVPGLAMEGHKNNIEKAVAGALAEAGLSSLKDVDAIAVTKGPGLEICLRVGLRKAQVFC